MIRVCFAGKIETQFVVKNSFLGYHTVLVWVEKQGRAGQATGDNIITPKRFACLITEPTYTHTHTHTLRICNTYCFSTPIMITRNRISITICLLCLSCLFCCQIFGSQKFCVPFSFYSGVNMQTCCLLFTHTYARDKFGLQQPMSVCAYSREKCCRHSMQ